MILVEIKEINILAGISTLLVQSICSGFYSSMIKAMLFED